MKAFKIKALVFAAALAGSASVMAQSSATANLTNTANVTASCVISATGFTVSYDPINTHKTTDLTDASANIVYTCTNGGTGGVIALNEGLHADTGSTLAAPLRRLAGATNTTTYLNYNLYKASTYADIWGTGDSTVTVPAVEDGTSQTQIVWAKIPMNQNVPVDSYTDTVTATISF